LLLIKEDCHMRTIAIANHKGGVGKTTTAVNLAGGLARSELRTLLVDVDAQAHATFWFVEDPSDVDFDLQDVISAGVPIDKAIRRTRIDGLDLLPATGASRDRAGVHDSARRPPQAGP